MASPSPRPNHVLTTTVKFASWDAPSDDNGYNFSENELVDGYWDNNFDTNELDFHMGD
jgi:hypothetical protein